MLFVTPLANNASPILLPLFVDVLLTKIPYVVTPVLAFEPPMLTFIPVLAPVAVLPETATSINLPVVSELLAT